MTEKKTKGRDAENENVPMRDMRKWDLTRGENTQAVASSTRRRSPVCARGELAPVHARVHAEVHTPTTRGPEGAPAQTQRQTPARRAGGNTDPYPPRRTRSVEETQSHPSRHPSSNPRAPPGSPSPWRPQPLPASECGASAHGVGRGAVREAGAAGQSAL